MHDIPRSNTLAAFLSKRREQQLDAVRRLEYALKDGSDPEIVGAAEQVRSLGAVAPNVRWEAVYLVEDRYRAVESMRVALAEVPQEAAVVLVHDAARPLVSDEVIGRVLAPLSEGYDGAVPVLPLHDTVKRVRGGDVVETLDRDGLVASQTPQAFVADALRRAADGEGTDCASLVEARGGRIKAVEGDPRLLKITSVEDLALVASWL